MQSSNLEPGHLRAVLDVLPVAVYCTDAAGSLTYFNPAAVEFSGRVPTLGVDRWCVTWKLFRTDGAPLPHDQCPMAVALKEGRTVRGEEAIAERPDGTRRLFTPYPTPLRNAAATVVGGINILADLTDRSDTPRSAELLSALVDSSFMAWSVNTSIVSSRVATILNTVIPNVLLVGFQSANRHI